MNWGVITDFYIAIFLDTEVHPRCNWISILLRITCRPIGLIKSCIEKFNHSLDFYIKRISIVETVIWFDDFDWFIYWSQMTTARHRKADLNPKFKRKINHIGIVIMNFRNINEIYFWSPINQISSPKHYWLFQTTCQSSNLPRQKQISDWEYFLLSRMIDREHTSVRVDTKQHLPIRYFHVMLQKPNRHGID